MYKVKKIILVFGCAVVTLLSACANPAENETNVPTVKLEPTSTLVPTEAPSPTSTPAPTLTSKPTATPASEPTVTLVPTDVPEPEPTSTPILTVEPSPTNTPTLTPTPTPVPTPTPMPTSTPIPTATPTPVQVQYDVEADSALGVKLAEEIVQEIITPGMSEFEKAITIHDWITFHIDYAHGNRYEVDTHYLGGTLSGGYAVCSGYSYLFETMAEMAGLEVKFVAAYAKDETVVPSSHAWNQVKIEGNWYNVDVSWDDPGSDDKDFNNHSENSYRYFLVSDERLNQDHGVYFPDAETEECPYDYDYKTILKYAVKSGLYGATGFVSDINELNAVMNTMNADNETEFDVWFYDESVTQDNKFECMESLVEESEFFAEVLWAYKPINGMTEYRLKIICKKSELGTYLRNLADSDAYPAVIYAENLEDIKAGLAELKATGIPEGQIWYLNAEVTQENRYTIMKELLKQSGYSVKLTGGTKPQYGLTRYLIQFK